MKPLAMIAVAVVAAGIGLAVGTLIGGRTGVASTTAPEAGDAERIDLEEEIARIEDAKATLKADVDAGRAENLKLRESLAAMEEKLAVYRDLYPEGPPAETPDAATADADPGFFRDRYEGVLRKVDWKSVGSTMGEMSQLIAAIVPDLESGKTPDMQKVGQIQKLNANLIAAAVTVQTELPGTGINGAFSDPAFMVNAVASTLAAVEMPLTDVQRKQIETIAADWIVADENRRKAYDDKTWSIVRIHEEAELKDGFFRDAFAVLTPAQIDALSPEASRGRVRLDLFSSSLIYAARVRPVPFENTQNVVEFFVEKGLYGFDLTNQEKLKVQELVVSWLDEVPEQLLFQESNALDLQGMVKTERVTAWAKLEVALMRRLAETIPFDEGRVSYARAVGGVAVPLKMTPKAE